MSIQIPESYVLTKLAEATLKADYLEEQYNASQRELVAKTTENIELQKQILHLQERINQLVLQVPALPEDVKP